MTSAALVHRGLTLTEWRGLVKFYYDPDSDVTQYAGLSFRQQGTNAWAALPLLVAALTNSNPNVRNAAS